MNTITRHSWIAIMPRNRNDHQLEVFHYTNNNKGDGEWNNLTHSNSSDTIERVLICFKWVDNGLYIIPKWELQKVLKIIDIYGPFLCEGFNWVTFCLLAPCGYYDIQVISNVNYVALRCCMQYQFLWIVIRLFAILWWLLSPRIATIHCLSALTAAL